MLTGLEIVFASAQLVLGLFDTITDKYSEWKRLRKEIQEQIIALKTETIRNSDILKELQKEDLSRNAIRNPGIRKLISQLRCSEAEKVSKDFDLFLGRKLKKEQKQTPAKNTPLKVFFAIGDTAVKIADLKDRAVRAAKPAGHATRTILSRRIPAIQKRLDIIEKALVSVPSSTLRKSKIG